MLGRSFLDVGLGALAWLGQKTQKDSQKTRVVIAVEGMSQAALWKHPKHFSGLRQPSWSAARAPKHFLPPKDSRHYCQLTRNSK